MDASENIEFGSPFGKIKLTPKNYQKWMVYMGIFGCIWMQVYNYMFVQLVKQAIAYFNA